MKKPAKLWVEPVYQGSSTVAIGFGSTRRTGAYKVGASGSVVGNDVHIHMWISYDPAKGHSKEALAALRKVFDHIWIRGAGGDDPSSPESYRNFQFWKHMFDLGLIDGMHYWHEDTGRLRWIKRGKAPVMRKATTL